MKIFNRTFFRFVSGFAGLILMALAFVFMAGYYEVEVKGKKKVEMASPFRESGGAVGINTSQKIKNNSLSPANNLNRVRSANWQPEYPPKLE